MKIKNLNKKCCLCPRNCGTNRENEQTGVCGVGWDLKIARAALHFWEEPCISGEKGSGAVFFSGCNLHCVFCQNEQIAQGIEGKTVSRERLVEIFLELQEQGANNINLVTPSQYIPHIIYGVEQARNQGLRIPVVYNTSSYEKVDSLKALEGIVDVYLPDFKYMSPELARTYSHAKDYPEIAKAALAEMVRQQPRPVFREDSQNEDTGMIEKGVIVRQLLLPGCLRDAKEVTSYLYNTYGNQIYISLMSQFTPLSHVEKWPELNRKVTKREYEAFVDHAISIGVEQGFLQEEGVAEESFIPHFDGEGV